MNYYNKIETMNKFSSEVYSNSFQKKSGIFLVIILFLVFFEDFFRMVTQVGGPLWLLIKDIITNIVSSYRKISFHKIYFPLIVYIFILFIIYFYTFISHNNSISLKLISARSEFLYIPLSLIIIQALKWNKFSVLLFKLFIVVLVLNISVSLLQFFASQLIEGVPGISGLREEGVKLHTWRSFGEQEITTIFGLFSGNGKFTRNLFHILIWIWLLHFIFKIGKFRNLIILSVFIGPILVISGKRLPVLMWMFFMLSIPLIMLVSRIVIDKIRVFDFKEFIFLKSVQYKVLALIFISFIFIVFLYGISEKAKLYVDLVSFVLTNKIEQRFF